MVYRVGFGGLTEYDSVIDMCSLRLLKWVISTMITETIEGRVYVCMQECGGLKSLVRLFLDTEQFKTTNTVMISIKSSNRTWEVPVCSGSELRENPLNLSHLGSPFGL